MSRTNAPASITRGHVGPRTQVVFMSCLGCLQTDVLNFSCFRFLPPVFSIESHSRRVTPTPECPPAKYQTVQLPAKPAVSKKEPMRSSNGEPTYRRRNHWALHAKRPCASTCIKGVRKLCHTTFRRKQPYRRNAMFNIMHINVYPGRYPSIMPQPIHCRLQGRTLHSNIDVVVEFNYIANIATTS